MTKVIETVTNLFQNFFNQMGFIPTNTGDFNTDWMPLIFRLIMIAVACLLIYLAISKGFEPYLLIPIGIGMLLVNIAPSLYNFGINKEAGMVIFDYLEDETLKVLNKPTAAYCVQVYNIYSGNHIIDLIRKGNGPKEMLLCQARIIDENLYIRDFAKGNYTVINLPILLRTTNDYDVPELKKYQEKFNVYDFIEINNQLLYLNPLCFEDRNYNVNNHEPRLIYGRHTWPRNAYDAFNVSQGTIMSSNQDSLIVFASLNTNELEIYDRELNPQVKVLGPTYFDVEYNFDGNHVTFKDNAYYGYQCVINAGDSFWATYQGELIDKVKQTYIIQYK